MTTLQNRVESAGGPDRGIDLEIMRYVMNIGGDPNNALHYTASLDAAMTLVPEGGFGSLIAGVFPGGRLGFVAVVTKPRRAEGEAATPALALCAAALRARKD